VRLVVGQSTASRVAHSLALRATSNSSVARPYVVIAPVLDSLPAPNPPADKRNAAEENGTADTSDYASNNLFTIIGETGAGATIGAAEEGGCGDEG